MKARLPQGYGGGGAGNMQSMIKQVTRGGKMPKGMGGFGGGRMRGFGRKKRFK